MTAHTPRTLRLVTCAFGLAAVIALAGCKSSGGGSKGSTTGGGRDPLVFGPNRIPPQNVPLNDRGGVGARNPKTDPLLERPVGKSGGRSGVGYDDDPSRFKGTHVPGPGTTPAALAGRTGPDEELKIDTPDNRVPLKPVGGVVPVEADGGAALDGLYRELESYGVRRDDRTLSRENGRFTFRAAVTNANGTKRAYTGAGDTAADAVKQVLDQLALDRR